MSYQGLLSGLSASLCFILLLCVSVNGLQASSGAVDVNGAGFLGSGTSIEKPEVRHMKEGQTSECVLDGVVRRE